MIITLYGGSSSGKSHMAEQLAVRLGGRLAYVATAINCGGDMALKIEKHQAERGGKGFVTIEKPYGLKITDLEGFDTVLIECMSNWLSNEIFSSEKDAKLENIYNFIDEMRNKNTNFVIVTNNIFDNGLSYSSHVVEYMKIFGKINIILGNISNIFLEIVCRQPICLKGNDIYAELV